MITKDMLKEVVTGTVFSRPGKADNIIGINLPPIAGFIKAPFMKVEGLVVWLRIPSGHERLCWDEQDETGCWAEA